MTDPMTSVLNNFLVLNKGKKKHSPVESILYHVVKKMTALELNSEVLERFPFSSLP